MRFELPQSTYRAILTLAPEERSHTAFIGLTVAFAAAEDASDANDPELTEDDYAVIGRGLAAMDAGDVIPGAEVFAELRAKHGFAKGNSPF